MENLRGACVDYLPISGFVEEIVGDIVHIVNLTDYLALIDNFVRVVAVLEEALAGNVAPLEDRAAFLAPFRHTSVHYADVLSPKVFEHPGYPTHAEHPLEVIADNLVIFPDSKSPHVVSEDLSRGYSLGLCHEGRVFNLADGEVLCCFRQTTLLVHLQMVYRSARCSPSCIDKSQPTVVVLDQLLNFSSLDDQLSSSLL